MSSCPGRFDLSEISLSDYRKGYRLFRLIGLLGSITLSIVWAGALATLAAQRDLSGLPSTVVAGFAFGAALVAVLVLAFLMNGPGAIALELQTDGLRLIYGNGRTKRFSWTDSRTTITLFEFPEKLPNGQAFPLSRFWLATRFPQSNPVTPEAFEAVLHFAE
jgi:hypothetical protein